MNKQQSNSSSVEMTFHDHIGVAKGLVTPDFCKTIREAFEYYWERKFMHPIATLPGDGSLEAIANTEGETQFKEGGLGRKDEQLFLEVADVTLASQINQAIGLAFERYCQEYKGVVTGSDPVSSWVCKIQKTYPGGGYHVWHCEDGTFLYRDRVITWMIYLNDIPPEDGGGTDFYHQKRTLHPTEGTVVLWPANYTHMHRGAFLTGENPKYIATGWFTREPGQVTNKLIGESMGFQEPTDFLNG